MVDAYFLRVAGPVTLNVRGKRLAIKKGDIVLGDYNYFISFPGFKHLPEYTPQIKKIISNREEVSTTPNFEELDYYDNNNPELSEQVQQLKEIVSGKQDKSFINVGNSAKEPINEEKKKINLSAFDDLRKYTNKDWFTVSKAQAISYLEAAGIDYSHLPDDRFGYIRFIKSILKENPNT